MAHDAGCRSVPTTSAQSEFDFRYLTGFKKLIISYGKIRLCSRTLNFLQFFLNTLPIAHKGYFWHVADKPTRRQSTHRKVMSITLPISTLISPFDNIKDNVHILRLLYSLSLQCCLKYMPITCL